ncbi:hypothetical protein IT575_02120 [bacterium]|nr:hypothetical protein [bacterium]
MEAFPARKLLCIGASADALARLSHSLPQQNHAAVLLDAADDLESGGAKARAESYAAVLLFSEDGAQDLLRAQAQLPQLPLIIVCSEMQAEAVDELLARGAVDVLPEEQLSPEQIGRSLRLALEWNRGRQLLLQAEAEIEELRRELQELQEFQRNVAIFAHEINSPLTGLLGFLQLIVEEVEEQEEDPDRAAMLRDSLEAATRIRRVMVKLHQITEPVYKKSRLSPRSLLELSHHGETIA